MIGIVQYLHKNRDILTLLKEGKVSLLNVNSLEKQFILESFESKTIKDTFLLYWHA
ncbi:hypothetical protein SAMN04487786_0190 [Paenisporosarcina quisquiliarum]|nr:hypothetical protein SAMN04487786_0190 [Paenisporosarcina quisquiliarum]